VQRVAIVAPRSNRVRLASRLPRNNRYIEVKGRTMSRTPAVSGFIVALTLTLVVSAHADPVTHWNNIIVTAATAGRSGPPGLLDIALAHAAIHDAVQAIEGRYQPYHYRDGSNLGAGSPAAAVAAAAHGVLVRLYLAQRPAIDAEYAAFVLANGLTGDPGLHIGAAAAQSLYDNHYRPVIPVTPSFGNTDIGQWRSPVPLGFQYLAVSMPFTLNRVDQFRPQPPPPLTSTRYAREYAEVAEVGSAIAHPNIDTDKARFWAGNFVAQWNETMRQLADAHVPEIGERARLFALANLTAADAAMAIWDSKVFYNFWRPITAIAAGDLDGNAKTSVDPAWTSLIASPPYPDYVSGANGLTGAFTGLLRLFFGADAMIFTVKNPAPLVIDKERDYTSFSQAAQEVVDARVLLGIHFRFADEEGRRLGERIAHWTFQKFLRPVPGR
jgi:hypothetical protein